MEELFCKHITAQKLLTNFLKDHGMYIDDEGVLHGLEKLDADGMSEFIKVNEEVKKSYLNWNKQARAT